MQEQISVRSSLRHFRIEAS